MWTEKNVQPATPHTCHYGPHSLTALKAYIDTYIWCGLGAALGGIFGKLLSDGTRTVMIESVLVGMFGAFIGAEFISAMLHTKGTPDPAFVVKLSLSLVGSVGLLFLLSLMRRSVGPMKNSQTKKRKDY